MLGFSNAGDRQSVVLSSLRDKALATAADRTSTLGIFDWSAPGGCELETEPLGLKGTPRLGTG